MHCQFIGKQFSKNIIIEAEMNALSCLVLNWRIHLKNQKYQKFLISQEFEISQINCFVLGNIKEFNV